jgi:DNA-binding response OmpR family regulator
MSQSSNEATPISMSLILVGVSDLDLGFILTMVLREEVSQEVLLVTDGKEMIEFCRLVTPQLVLLDEQLLEMDAQALYKCLCQCDPERQIPVLLLGSPCHQDGHDQHHLHWIKKPFHWDKLLQTVKALLEAL